jgi:cytoskeleton protein RodZ
VLLSRVNAPGSRETIKGAPPLSLTIGNAHEVDLVYNGKRVDLGPHSIKNVARLMLR